ncbi:hypothetical protein FBZ99_101270 [Rhizobium sp. ERR 1071]|uniref:hypothetical protein n=1 Tax=Rhizobium sp. ERR 1071 TaxID=2572677 RepID=UPI00119C2DAA|nr:hypothetical protein [Rhizobium sp. ERR1071]TWB19501.1 hypothetical protein FBZ99_101270 [Rhizobium sp. ERR1071]
MKAKFKSFAEALSAEHAPMVAANDNKPAKEPQPRYRGTLPALRWLFDNHPELAAAMAAAMPKSESSWDTEISENRQEIRPTIGELMTASAGSSLAFQRGEKGYERITLGSLKFRNGELLEWGETKKGHKLRPVDRVSTVRSDKAPARDNDRYLKTKPTTRSPLEAMPLPRNISSRPVLPPMLDPLPGRTEARRLLQSFGVDGSVPFEQLSFPATRCDDAIAKGAGFIGGVSNLKGNTSGGAQAWEAPEPRKGEAAAVIEEVAARGTLKSIGLKLGYSDDYADRAGKAALVEAARVLSAANDNKVTDDVPKRAAK